MVIRYDENVVLLNGLPCIVNTLHTYCGLLPTGTFPSPGKKPRNSVANFYCELHLEKKNSNNPIAQL